MVKRNFFVQTGRVAVVNFGKYAGKYVTILDVLDASRVLVDGPTSKVPRQIMPIKHLGLTNIKFFVPRTAKSHALKKALITQGVVTKAKKNAWVAKAKQENIRANLTDFQRFQVAQLKKQKKAILKA